MGFQECRGAGMEPHDRAPIRQLGRPRFVPGEPDTSHSLQLCRHQPAVGTATECSSAKSKTIPTLGKHRLLFECGQAELPSATTGSAKEAFQWFVFPG